MHALCERQMPISMVLALSLIQYYLLCEVVLIHYILSRCSIIGLRGRQKDGAKVARLWEAACGS